MNEAYKVDERVLQDLILDNVKCTNPSEKLRLNIYYKSPKVSHCLIKNSPKSTNDTQKVNVVYQFSCPFEGCKLQPSHYIGFTRTTLSRRMTYHLNDGLLNNTPTNVTKFT